MDGRLGHVWRFYDARTSGFGQDGVAHRVQEVVVRGDEGAERPDRRAERVEVLDRQAVRLIGPAEVGERASRARR